MHQFRPAASLHVRNERGIQIRITVLTVPNKWKSIFESIFIVNYKCMLCRGLLNRNLLTLEGKKVVI